MNSLQPVLMGYLSWGVGYSVHWKVMECWVALLDAELEVQIGDPLLLGLPFLFGVAAHLQVDGQLH